MEAVSPEGNKSLSLCELPGHSEAAHCSTPTSQDDREEHAGGTKLG